MYYEFVQLYHHPGEYVCHVKKTAVNMNKEMTIIEEAVRAIVAVLQGGRL